MASWVGWWLAAQVTGVSPEHWAAYRIAGDEGDVLVLTVVAPATSRVVGRSVREAVSVVLANLHHGDLALWRGRPDWLEAGLLEGVGVGDGGASGEASAAVEGVGVSAGVAEDDTAAGRAGSVSRGPPRPTQEQYSDARSAHVGAGARSGGGAVGP